MGEVLNCIALQSFIWSGSLVISCYFALYSSLTTWVVFVIALMASWSIKIHLINILYGNILYQVFLRLAINCNHVARYISLPSVFPLQVVLLLLTLIFALVHSGMASLRETGEKIIGERAYRVLFAGISLPLAVSTIVSILYILLFFFCKMASLPVS